MGGPGLLCGCRKYRYMERSLLLQKDTLRAKILAIKETMDAIKLLQRQRVGEIYINSCIFRV